MYLLVKKQSTVTFDMISPVFHCFSLFPLACDATDSVDFVLDLRGRGDLGDCGAENSPSIDKDLETFSQILGTTFLYSPLPAQIIFSQNSQLDRDDRKLLL